MNPKQKAEKERKRKERVKAKRRHLEATSPKLVSGRGRFYLEVLHRGEFVPVRMVTKSVPATFDSWREVNAYCAQIEEIRKQNGNIIAGRIIDRWKGGEIARDIEPNEGVAPTVAPETPKLQ